MINRQPCACAHFHPRGKLHNGLEICWSYTRMAWDKFGTKIVPARFIWVHFAREALKAFIETSHDDDDFFLITFNQRAELIAEFTDGESLLNKLTLVDPRGQTALYDAAYLGVEKVKQGRHSKRAILLISDGQDNSSRYTYGELRKLLKEANVQIYCLGIVELGGGAGSTLDLGGQAILEEMSQTTGGKAFFPRSGAELEDATTRIALELRHQYSLGYVPNNEQQKGDWRKIRVRVNPPRPARSKCSREGRILRIAKIIYS
jgi:Ca-activated chloride channel homolog